MKSLKLNSAPWVFATLAIPDTGADVNLAVTPVRGTALARRGLPGAGKVDFPGSDGGGSSPPFVPDGLPEPAPSIEGDNVDTPKLKFALPSPRLKPTPSGGCLEDSMGGVALGLPELSPLLENKTRPFAINPPGPPEPAAGPPSTRYAAASLASLLADGRTGDGLVARKSMRFAASLSEAAGADTEPPGVSGRPMAELVLVFAVCVGANDEVDAASVWVLGDAF